MSTVKESWLMIARSPSTHGERGYRMDEDIIVSRIEHDSVEYAPASHDALDKTDLAATFYFLRFRNRRKEQSKNRFIIFIF